MSPICTRMYPVLVPHHDRGWTDAYPLRSFNGGGAHGYKSPVTVQPYTPHSFDKGPWRPGRGWELYGQRLDDLPLGELRLRHLAVVVRSFRGNSPFG